METPKKLNIQPSAKLPLCVNINQLLTEVNGSNGGGVAPATNPVVTFLEKEHFSGRKLYLASEHTPEVAYQVAESLQIFSGIITDSEGDRSGKKSKPMRDLLVEAFGRKNFDYLGALQADADVIHIANQSFEYSKRLQAVCEIKPRLAEPSMFAEVLDEPNSTVADYVSIARPDHWFKNIFVLPGVFLAPFFFSVPFSLSLIGTVFLALAATCLVASSNYVINELLDAPQDRYHPVKRFRPVAAGRIRTQFAILEWLLLGASGILLGFMATTSVGYCCLALWIMGCVYNIPPIRTKELPYLDVLSESINNPLRMAIGWYATGIQVLPPVSALFAYWMLGAFLMATKRFAEYRRIANPELAGQYRSSFKFYSEENLLASNVAYVALFMTGAMAFVMLYRLELVFAVPAFAYLLAYYVFLGFKSDSPVQYPEKLYQEKHLVTAVAVNVAWCLALFFMVDLPWFAEIFQLLTPRQY